MLNVNRVLEQMDPADSAGGRLNVVILDACRNNPFESRMRSAGRGLNVMQAPEGTLISFATQPGSVAQDGDGDHSPFTLALAEVIRRPGLGLFDAFNEIGLRVKRTTGTQQPWLSSSPIAGQFYFAGLPADTGGGGTRPAGPGADEAAWSMVQDTNDAEQIRRFIARFPSSPRRREAEERLKALEQANVALTLTLRPSEMAKPADDPQAGIPQSFQWYYRNQPEGWRYWYRNGPNQWIEKYPDGTQNNFVVLRSYQVDQCPGVLVLKVKGDTNDPTTQVFIPSHDCTSQNLIFRFMGPSGPISEWKLLGKIEETQY